MGDMGRHGSIKQIYESHSLLPRSHSASGMDRDSDIRRYLSASAVWGAGISYPNLHE